MVDLRQSAQALIDRVLRRRTPPPAAQRTPLEETLKEDAPPRAIRDAAKKRGEAWNLETLISYSVSLNVILAGLLFATTQITKSRPRMMIESRGDFREQIRSHFAVTDLRKDNIFYFLHTVLTLRNDVTKRGAPFMATLQGLVASKVLEDAQDDLKRNMTAVENEEMARTLVIEEITGIDIEEQNGRQTGRLSAIVKGTMPIQARPVNTAAQRQAKPKTTSKKDTGPLALAMPYRALVVVDSLPVSNLNPFGYYLVSLREVSGDTDVAAFDREMATKQAHARGQ